MTASSKYPDATWIVLPAYNEAENLEAVIGEILAVCDREVIPVVVLLVDDGSTDGTAVVLQELADGDPRVLSRRLRRNEGKSAALSLGLRVAVKNGAGAIVMMDADGQDNPNDLGRLLAQLADGSDLVTGARLVRHDRWLKRVTSRLYNTVTRLVSGIDGTDFNSGYKAMTPELAVALVPTLYGELHRYLTVVSAWRGFVVTEVEVTHRARLAGKSKYGIARFWRGLVDLLTIRFLMTYENRPSHLFSGVGLVTSLVGVGILAYLTVLWFTGVSIGDRPILIAGVLLVLAGLQVLLFGLIAELLVFGRHRDRVWPDDA